MCTRRVCQNSLALRQMAAAERIQIQWRLKEGAASHIDILSGDVAVFWR